MFLCVVCETEEGEGEDTELVRGLERKGEVRDWKDWKREKARKIEI